MTTLDELLSKTLLRTGSGRLTSSVPGVLRGEFWSFRASVGSPTKVTDLRCTQPASGQHPAHGKEVISCGLPGPSGARVCEDVTWTAPTFEFQIAQGPLEKQTLQLSDEFRLISESVSGGSIAERANPHWPIALDVDVGVHHVFAYEWDTTLRRFKPVDRVAAQREGFWSAISQPVSNGGNSGQTSRTNSYQVVPLRLLVCVSLVCCKPKANFTPGNSFGFPPQPLRAARFFPHLAVLTNKSYAIKRYDAHIELMRPAASNAMPHDNGEAMSPSIAASCYTDTNFTRDVGIAPTLLPLWEYIFDYFKEAIPVGQEFVAVYPSMEQCAVTLGTDASGQTKRSNEKRTYRECVTQLENGMVDTGPKRVKRGIRKMPGQGEFDNMHLAPTMTSTDGVKHYPGFGFEKIIMAPFCVHDCLHMHWRWGVGLPALQSWNSGWLGDTMAYAVEGAPMVPTHQQVWITPLARGGAVAHGLRYRVRGNHMGNTDWDVTLSHGAAYSYDLTAIGSVISSAPAALNNINLDPTWANTYWWLRYDYRVESTWSTTRKPHERLEFVNGEKEMVVRRG